MADSDPVIAPDQLKPGSRKWGRIGAIVTALLLVAMIFKNNDVTGIAQLWLIGTALLLVGIVVVDSVLRRNGLR